MRGPESSNGGTELSFTSASFCERNFSDGGAVCLGHLIRKDSVVPITPFRSHNSNHVRPSSICPKLFKWEIKVDSTCIPPRLQGMRSNRVGFDKRGKEGEVVPGGNGQGLGHPLHPT